MTAILIILALLIAFPVLLFCVEAVADYATTKRAHKQWREEVRRMYCPENGGECDDCDDACADCAYREEDI